mmetsp:Transcript_6351/g.20336  ORF Transcript_6351/g.20336 Transcript_6351/m.20336 type:complete len:203 (+) Transcript_6351:3-611(+)
MSYVHDFMCGGGPARRDLTDGGSRVVRAGGGSARHTTHTHVHTQRERFPESTPQIDAKNHTPGPHARKVRSWDDPLASGGSARASTRAASAPAKVARGRRRAPLSLYMPADCPERSAELLFQPQQLRHVVGLHEAACALGRHPRHHAADRVAEWPLPRLALPLRLWPVELQPAAEPQLADARRPSRVLCLATQSACEAHHAV